MFAVLLALLSLQTETPVVLSAPGAKAFAPKVDNQPDLLYRLKRQDFDPYFSSLSAKGLNAVQIQLFLEGQTDVLGYGGQSHFDLALPNPAFFQHLDWVLKKAQSRGIQVLILPATPMYWSERLAANGPEKARDFGRYLGRRYLKQRNAFWLSGTNPALDEGLQFFLLR